MDRWKSLLRVAVRTLSKSPSFTIAAVLTLAAGVGANTAIFSLTNRALFRPVAGVDQPGDLVTIEMGRAGEETLTPVSNPTVQRFIDNPNGLVSFSAYSPFAADVLLESDGRPQRMNGHIVTSSYFRTLGVHLQRGRVFRPQEGSAVEVHRVAMISHGFWQNALAADENVIGRSIDVNGNRFNVVGITSAEFKGPGRADDVSIWVPASAASLILPRIPPNILQMEGVPFWLRMVGRLAEGATPEAVRIALERAAPEVVQDGREIRVDAGVGLSRGLRNRLTETLVTLGMLVSLLLLLTVANLTNLILSRVARRRREACVRKAMGASTLHLTADLVAEGLVLAAVGSVVAVMTGWGLLRLLDGTQVLRWLPEVDGVPLDHRVLAFSLFVVLLAVGIATMVGALRVQHSKPMDVLRSHGANVGRRRLFRRGLVCAQVALSLSLVVGAGLMVRAVDRLFATELGFETEGVAVFSLSPGAQGYSDVDADRIFRDVANEVSAIPAVGAVGFTWLAPLGPQQYSERVRTVGAVSDEDLLTVSANMVTPSYFDAMGIDVVEGRVFDAREYERADRPERGTVVLNRSLAQQLFPDGNAVGAEIQMEGRRELAFQVIGVVADARLASLQEPPAPALFDPFGNGYRTSSATFVVRSTDDPAALLQRIESLVRTRDPRLPVLQASTLSQRAEEGVTEERALGRLIGMLAVLSLVLAGAGLFGLVSESVQARTREFGIRTALGARAMHVAGLVVRDSLVMMIVGSAAGLILALWTAGLLETRLFGMEAIDPVTFLAATVLLGIVALVAALEPAWRSTRVDPARVLRTE